MKKLMMALGVALCAVAANAATISWGSGTLYHPDEAGAKSGTKAQSGATGKNAPITAYLYVIDSAATYNALFSYVAGTTDIDVDKTIANVVSAYAGKSTTISGNTSNMGSVTLTDTATYSVGQTAYAALIYETTINGEKQYLGDLGSYYVAADGNQTVGKMGTNFMGTTATNIESKWTAAPEPTSGLLLLIGMAGLALRRRRA